MSVAHTVGGLVAVSREGPDETAGGEGGEVVGLLELQVAVGAELGPLRARVAEHACADTWRNIRDDLKGLQLAQLIGSNGTLWQVTEPRQSASNRLKPLQISPPPAILKGTDQNAAIHLYTHERACPEARSARGRGCPMTRGRGSARGLVQCRRGRTAEQREPVVDPLSGQALVSASPLVPSPAPPMPVATTNGANRPMSSRSSAVAVSAC